MQVKNNTAHIRIRTRLPGKWDRLANRRLRQNIPLFIMLLPVLAFYLIFKYIPMFGLVLAFKTYRFSEGILHSPWAGFTYFNQIFTNEQTILIIRNTLKLSLLNVIVGFPFPIIMAIMLNEARKMWYKRMVQTMVYLPHFFSWVIVGGIVLTLFAQEDGIVNNFLRHWTGDAFPFLYNNTSWITIFLGAGVWKEAGFGAIIYLAAISSIEPGLYEAASLDGAGKLKQIWHITLPGAEAVRHIRSEPVKLLKAFC